MNINNVTALLAQDKLVALSDINPNESYLVVNVKQVNRGTEEFFPYALPVSELSNMTDFCSINLRESVVIGPVISFNHPSNSGITVVDRFSNTVALTRDPSCGNGCLFNTLAGETCCDAQSTPGASPHNTEWFWVQNPMTYNYALAPSETYKAILDIATNDWSGMINAPGKQVIMHDILSDEYWIIDFLTWQSGGQGAFTWNRRKLTVNCDGCIHFPDGTIMCSAPSVTPPTVSILTGDIYYVDSLYGNNATGTVSDFTKPYLTIAAAFAAITPGDKATIYVRSGVYTGEIISLQDQVDYYLEPGAVFSSTSINSPASGISNIFGSGRFVNSSINITNEITGVFEFDTFEGNSTRVFVASINSGDSDFILKGNSIVCNGFLNFETQGNIDLTVNVKRITINTWFGFTYYNYTGKTIFNVDYIDGVGAGNFALHFSESNTTSAAEIIYNIGGQITHQPNFNGFNYTFFVRGGKVTLNGKLVASGAPGVLLQNGGTNTEFKLNGYINAARQALVMNAGNGGRAFIQGRLETQGVAGSDVILFSSVSINGQAGGSSQLYLTDTMLINQLNNGNMINMSGAGVGPINDVYCYNVTGYSPGVNGFFVYSSTVGASRTIGNHNVRSNKTLDLTNVSESFAPSGFISDAAFVLPINI